MKFREVYLKANDLTKEAKTSIGGWLGPRIMKDYTIYLIGKHRNGYIKPAGQRNWIFNVKH